MSIKSILVPLLGTPQDKQVILLALDIARDLGAHVTVMFSGGYLSELVSAVPPGHAGVKPQLQIDARALLAEQTEAARSAFNARVREHDLKVVESPCGPSAGTVHFEVRRGTVEATVKEAAVYQDLIVFCRDGSDTRSFGYSAIKSALQSSGRPVLILPERLSGPFASHVAIAWNGSIEGAHAVSAALPILKSAQWVHILIVATEKTSPDQADRMRAFLGRHGVQSTVHKSAPMGESVGATLLAMSQDAGADLLVLGAYTHNRIRETILGGVTQFMVTQGGMALLFSR
jgi:nucleotide-binding universal stress UspA family protein